MKFKLFLLIVLFCSGGVFSQSEKITNVQKIWLKEKIVQNYLHKLALDHSRISFGEKENFAILDIPDGYSPVLELLVLPDSLQFLDSLNITLYKYDRLGIATKLINPEQDTFSESIIILGLGNLRPKHSDFQYGSGVVGYSDSRKRVYYFSGPLLLHEISKLTVRLHFHEKSIRAYLSIKYATEGIKDIKIEKLDDQNESILASYYLDNSLYCQIFSIDPLTRDVQIERPEECQDNFPKY